MLKVAQLVFLCVGSPVMGFNFGQQYTDTQNEFENFWNQNKRGFNQNFNDFASQPAASFLPGTWAVDVTNVPTVSDH